MATANEKIETRSSISGDAFELLDCFVSGLDDIVYEFAEEIARRRSECPTGAVEIEAADVREAAHLVFDSIKKAAGDRDLPPGLVAEIEGMVRCLEAKCQT